MISAGALTFIGGGVLGLSAFARQGVLNGELCPEAPAGETCSGSNLRPRSYYEAQDIEIGQHKTWSLALLLGGAALAGAGLYLMPPPEGGPRVAVVPSANGFVLVGVLP
jgi:hypothetical protein